MRGSSGEREPSKPIFVIDSWPFLEWFKTRQPAAARFDRLVKSAQTGEVLLVMSSINLGEIFYNVWYDWGRSGAEAALAIVQLLPINVIHPDEEDVLLASRVKAEYRIAYADCFAVVLATSLSASVVTGDPDFLKVARDGLISVEWWGA